jgi:energy-coupling factor transport system permease protein
VAWWLWALLLAAAASRITNPVLLALLLAVVGFVVAARRPSAPWGRSYGAFLRLAAVVLLIRTVFHVLLGAGTGTTVLLDLPQLELGEWAAGIRIGGPVTAEGMAFALTDALRLGTMLACIGAANALASPRRLLRALPSALYEVSVAVTVALSLAPQMVEHVLSVRRARALRGEPDRGWRGARRILVPVLDGALDRSMQLAAGMEARGYGRAPDRSPAQRRTTSVLVVGGLLALCIGSYGLLGDQVSASTSWVALALGAGLATVALRVGAGRVQRTRHKPDVWAVAEALVIASGVAALGAVVAVGATNASSLTMPYVPLALPDVPILAMVGLLVALAPAVAAPDPRANERRAGSRPVAPRLVEGVAA